MQQRVVRGGRSLGKSRTAKERSGSGGAAPSFLVVLSRMLQSFLLTLQLFRVDYSTFRAKLGVHSPRQSNVPSRLEESQDVTARPKALVASLI